MLTREQFNQGIKISPSNGEGRGMYYLYYKSETIIGPFVFQANSAHDAVLFLDQQLPHLIDHVLNMNHVDTVQDVIDTLIWGCETDDERMIFHFHPVAERDFYKARGYPFGVGKRMNPEMSAPFQSYLRNLFARP